MPRPIAPLALQPADVLTPQGWRRMGTVEQSLAQRALILLLLNDGGHLWAVTDHVTDGVQVAKALAGVGHRRHERPAA